MVCIYALNTFWIWLLIDYAPIKPFKDVFKGTNFWQEECIFWSKETQLEDTKKKGLLMPFLLFKSDVQVNGMQFCRSSLLQIITFKATLHKRRLMHLIAARNKVCTFQYRIHYIHSNRAWRLEKALRSHNS